MPVNLQTVWTLLKATFNEWKYRKVTFLASSVAYFTVFSLAPLLAITITIVGAIFGEATARGEIVAEIQQLFGTQVSQVIETAIINTRTYEGDPGFFGLTFNLCVLAFGASRVFVQIQRALNRVWEVKPEPKRSLFHYISKRLLSLVMVLIVACLLLLSFAVSAVLEIFVEFLEEFLPGLAYFWLAINTLLSFSVLSFSFTLIYQILPDVRVRWRDAGVGATITAILFMLGQVLFGEFLSKTDLGSAYGVAGSFVIIIAWVYYSAHIFLFGAEFTQVYARRHGSPIVPAAHAVRAYRAPEELLVQEEEGSSDEEGEGDRNSTSLTNFLTKIGKSSLRFLGNLLR